MKVSIIDFNLIKKTFFYWLGLVTFSSTVVTFIEVNWQVNLIVLVVLAVLFIPMHFLFWHYANNLKSITLNINNSDLIIEFGDIFKEEDIKIIGFNEYFDTSFENGLIAESSLHGKYLKTLTSTDTLDQEIDELPIEKMIEENISRKHGKKKKYKLGTILQRTKYFLLALSHFNDDNEAYLTQNDYVACLLNMWAEIDKIYNQRTVCIPLLGSGITRMKDNRDISDQELLSIMIWSFRISKVKFSYPSKIKIVLFDKKSNKINLFKIKENN